MEHDPFDIVGQERTRKDLDERAKLNRKIEGEDIRWLMSSRRGRRIVWRLLERTGIYRSSFTGNSETFFREGMRNVGLALLATVHEVAADQYTVMVTEQRSDDRSNDSSSEPS